MITSVVVNLQTNSEIYPLLEKKRVKITKATLSKKSMGTSYYQISRLSTHCFSSISTGKHSSETEPRKRSTNMSPLDLSKLIALVNLISN